MQPGTWGIGVALTVPFPDCKEHVTGTIAGSELPGWQADPGACSAQEEQ